MSTWSDAEARVLTALDEERLVRTLVELVRVPSVTGSDAESELQAMLAGRLTELGLEVDSWRLALDELYAADDFPGVEAERGEGHGVVGNAAGTAGEEVPALVLQGHVDVVPVGDPAKWGQADPFQATISGDILHGRGACDMKAGLAANLAVAQALRDSGLRFERGFALHCVVSEEDGGLGAYATLRRGHTGEFAVIPEPTSGRLVTACAGALTFTLEVPGRAAHGSARLSGVSAIENFLTLHPALAGLEARRNADPDPLFAGNPLPYAISVGTVRGGDWASSVPDLLTAEGRMGVRLDEDPATARAELEQVVAEVCARHPFLRDQPIRVSWSGGQFGSGRIEADHAFIGETQQAIAAVSGRAAALGAAPYGSDLRLYTGVGGIPTLHYGPGDVAMAHAPREQVSIAETIQVARTLAVLAVRRLGGHAAR
ncbi:peptidase M20 [Enemella evansiae]|uniref:ArgE/DapE family deacylase n=1 Tax=Enemella evansiae TaxID=2016499 RepID=UPI000B969BED|nr:ArgE/DapE family deacylase [Enemella evansiae]OYO07766.1 peptidase M20 [Enemella evansiae]